MCIPYLFQEPAENLVLTQLGMSSYAQQKYLKQDASKVSHRIWGKMMRCKRYNNNNCFTETRHMYFTETERHMYFTETERHMYFTETELDLKWTELYTTPAFETELDLKWTELYTTPAFETELDLKWTELYTTPAFETELDLKWTELYTTPAFETELDLKWTELYTTPAFETELDWKWTELYTTPAFETELDWKWTELYSTPAFETELDLKWTELYSTPSTILAVQSSQPAFASKVGCCRLMAQLSRTGAAVCAQCLCAQVYVGLTSRAARLLSTKSGSNLSVEAFCHV